MRFDPFRDLDRLAQQAFGGVIQVRSIPRDGYRRGTQYSYASISLGSTRTRSILRSSRTALTLAIGRFLAQVPSLPRLFGHIDLRKPLALPQHGDPDIDAGHFSPGEYIQVRGPVGSVAAAEPDLNGVRQQAHVLRVGNSNAPGAQEHKGLSIHLLVLAHLVLPTDTLPGPHPLKECSDHSSTSPDGRLAIAAQVGLPAQIHDDAG
jgi:hypothetical protein